MDPTQNEDELTNWFSTYGLITAERVLSTYQIELPQELLTQILYKNTSFYHQLLQVPLKNLFNGIILQQAADYHVYAQKLLIDYLLSASAATEEVSVTQKALEDERIKLTSLGEAFIQVKLDHDNLIAKSQSFLIQWTINWHVEFEKTLRAFKSTLSVLDTLLLPSQVRLALNHALIQVDVKKEYKPDIAIFDNAILMSVQKEIKEELLLNFQGLLSLSSQFPSINNEFLKESQEFNERVKWYRTKFHDAIIKITELINVLSDYKINEEQDITNRELLYFDKTIGE